MPCRKLFDLAYAAASGKRAVRAATAYREYPLRLSFSSYAEGMDWLARQYREIGLESERVPFPADGKTTFGDRHFPLAWDIEEGWLKVNDSGCPEQALADYRADSYGIVPFSGDSGGVRDGVLVPVAALREKGLPLDKPVVALFDQYPMAADVQWARTLGCGACAACPGIDPSNAVKYNARRWFNDLFGEGQIDARHKTLPAFSLAPRQVAVLLKWYETHGPIPVSYLIRSRTFAGTAPVVTARILGQEEPDRQVIISAHAYEPNATNNCSGVAVCLEAARVLTELTASGALPPARKSIRFLHGLEIFGPYAYALQRRDELRNTVLGLTVDSFGSTDMAGHREKMILIRQPCINPSFAHSFTHEVVATASEKLKIGHELADGSSSNDDLLQDPLFGPGWSLLYGDIWSKIGYYHTNADVPANLSPERLAGWAALAATTAYFVANAGEKEAKFLSRTACADALALITDRCRLALKSVPSGVEFIRERGRKLNAFAGTVVPSGAAAIESPAQLLPEPAREAFLKEVAPLTTAFRAAADAEVRATLTAMATLAGETSPKFFKVRLTPLEREAANMVVTRNLPGPLGLGTLSEADRREAAKFAGSYVEEYWNYGGLRLLWFNGKRSLLDAALADWAFSRWNEAEDGSARMQALRTLVDMAAFLEKHGYVEVERKPVPPPVTGKDIAAGVRRIGVKAGDLVLVHSSLSQFGEVAGGADAVIDALMEVITPEGILAMPCFTNTATGEPEPPFDPKKSEVYTGTIPETFWRRPGVPRNGQLTHSIAAWGKRAGEFLQSTDLCNTFDRRGPWGKLYDWNGKILCFGETMGANTYLHALEAWLLCYLDFAFARVMKDNREQELRITNYPDGCRGWYGRKREAEYFKRLDALGIYRETKIGAAAALVVNVRDLSREMHRLFKEDPAILLHKSGCLPCAERRARLEGWKVPDSFPTA